MKKFFEDGKCPICGNKYKSMNPFKKFAIIFECASCGNFGLSQEILKMSDEKSEFLYKCINLMHYFLISHQSSNVSGLPYVFFYVEGYEDLSRDPRPEIFINLHELMNSYPKGYHERLHFVMRNLSCRFPSIGFCIEEFNKTILDYAYKSACNGKDVSNFDARTFCCSTNDRFQISEEIQQAVRDLEELKYIKTFSDKIELENSINQIDNSCTSQFFTISLDGWSLIESQKRQLFKQGFIAIKFSEEAKIISSAIKLGINEAGYVPLMISDKEYNGQIVPEIFFEISRSLFVVMDSTHPNSGAYYEAGYAKGMKIPVIYTCKKDNFDNITNKEDRPHFDIQQENHILWTDEKDLTSRLKKRIEATMVQR